MTAKKYHINPSTGNPGICVAEKGSCRYGATVPHFSSEADARTAYEAAQSGAFNKATLTKQASSVDETFSVKDVEFKSSIWNYNPAVAKEYNSDIAGLELFTRRKNITIGYGSAFHGGGYEVNVEENQGGGWWGDGKGVYGLKTVEEARAAAEKLAFEDTRKHLSKLKTYAGVELTDDVVIADLKKIKDKIEKEGANGR